MNEEIEEEIKKIEARKPRFSKRSLVAIAVVAMLTVSLVTAGLLSYYGSIDTDVTVEQAIWLDNHPWNVPVDEDITILAGCTKYTEHELENKGCVEAPINFVISGTGNDQYSGITMYYYLMELQTKNSATAEWSNTCVAHLKTTGLIGSGDEARIHIDVPPGTTLGNIEEISWDEYLISGYPPHVDIKITDGTNNDALVIEYAYNEASHGTEPHTLNSCYGALLGNWYQTFSDDGNGPEVVDDNAYAWLSSGPAGGPDIIGGTLSEWKTEINTGQPIGTVDSGTLVTAIEIEIDNWIPISNTNTEAKIKNIHIKGMEQLTSFTLAPETLYGLMVVYHADIATEPGLYSFSINVQP